MITNIETERRVIDALVELWDSEVRPHVVTNACVLSARIASEVLSHFGIQHEVFPMAAMAMNDEMLKHQQEGVHYSAWSPTAWSVGVGFGQMVATNKDSRDGTGFDGHVVVVTENHYIDLTAYQFDRLEHHINTGGSIVVPMGELKYPFTLSTEMPNEWIYLSLFEGHLLLTPNGNSSFMDSPDWCLHYKRQSGDIIRKIQAKISS